MERNSRALWRFNYNRFYGSDEIRGELPTEMKKQPRRESHAKMMLGLAMTKLARLNAGTALLHEITIAAKEVERWKQILADESLPLVRK